MVTVFVSAGGFELLGAGAVGRRRHLDSTAVEALAGFSARYTELLKRKGAAGDLLDLGRDLYRWLDGDSGDLTRLIGDAPRPLRFEICCTARRPPDGERALLDAPWELLADSNGFLAGDVRLGFALVRRLGRAVEPAAPGEHRLGLAFMAASPEGAVELDYEAEETAIIEAIGSVDLDLTVEESGNPDLLGRRLAEYPTIHALHLSCHGQNRWRLVDQAEAVPVLLLEDQEGGALPTSADALVMALRAAPPRLVFLSACLSAAAGERGGAWLGEKHSREVSPSRGGTLLPSLAEALVDGGIPAVLGWDGSVLDRSATVFAAEFYGKLAARSDLADAVADARRHLLNAGDEVLRGDWHLARLWLGPGGGGVLVGGTLQRRSMLATQGEQEFLLKQQVPVASRHMFVGRRREMQKALRAFKDGQHAGVLLHGMGRLGKSSLAARLVNRRRDLRPALMFEHYGPLDLLQALRDTLADVPAAQELLRAGTETVRDKPERLVEVLTGLFGGPCGRQTPGSAPVLLVIDDLERVLEADRSGGRHRVDPVVAPVLEAALVALKRAQTDSRMIVTSRFPFVLGGHEAGLFDLPLPPLAPNAQAKLARRQVEEALQQGWTAEALADREALRTRAIGLARGNPGLQDLIGRKLVLSTAVTAERVGQALDEMQAWLSQGGLPSEPEIRDFLEGLAIDTLLELAGSAGKALLRSLTLFQLPVPESVVTKLEGSVGGSVQRLRDLGLVDTVTDPTDHRSPALAVNALAGGRLEALSEPESRALAHLVVQDLFAAWGGQEAEARRPGACDMTLTRLALLAEDGEVATSCAAFATVRAGRHSAAVAAALGQSSIALLDQQGREMPLRLLSETAGAIAALGDGAAADGFIERGVKRLEALREAGAAVNPMAAGFLLMEYGDRLLTRGDLEGAESRFSQAAYLAQEAGQEVNAAVARGRLADILYARGDLDGALRVLEKEILPIFQQRGEARATAVTMSKIANILFSLGDFDGAVRILKEECILPFERLGDMHACAVSFGQVGDILFSQGDLDGALRIRETEQLPVFERLGDVREATLTRGQIADILVRRGDLDKALHIRREVELPVYKRLGDVHALAVVQGKIADILRRNGDLDGALRLRQEEELPVHERLGNMRECAVTMGKIADLFHARGDLVQARMLQNRQLELHQQLGYQDGICAALWALAQLDVAEGKVAEAVRRITESYRIAHTLGRADGVAVIGMLYGEILAVRGGKEEALAVLKDSAEMYRKLGDKGGAEAVAALIRKYDLE